MTIPEGYSQVNLKYTGTAMPNGAQNVFGVQNNLDMSPADLADAVHDAWVTNLKSLFTSDVTLASILVKNGPDDTGPAAEVGYGEVGPGSGVVVPGQVAALITKFSGLGGKRGRGRLYHCGIFPGMLNADQATLLTATQDALTGQYDAFRADLGDALIPMVLLHADATTPTPVTSMVCQNLLATQRRRVRP